MKTGLKSSIITALLLAGAGAPAFAEDKPSAYFCEDVKKPFFQRSASGLVTPVRPGSVAAPFHMPKPPGVTRIFVAGESAAMILATGPARPGLEIINCGMGGYESYRIEVVLKEILEYQPDMIVLLSGNNESGDDPCPGLKPELRRRKLKLLERYYSFTGSASALTNALIKTHERRVNSMAAAAAEAHVPLAICSLPGNMLMPPGGEPPLSDPDYAYGLVSFEKGSYGEAAASFRELPKDPAALYFAGRSLYASGDKAGAAPLLSSAEDLSPSHERAGPARNAMLRRAAAAGGACFADLDLAFRNASPGGITDFGMFDDEVHWKPSYNKFAWDVIFSAAKGCGIKAAGAYSGFSTASQENAAAKRLSYALSWLDGKTLNERAGAELESLIREDNPTLEKAMVSKAGLQGLVIHNFWNPGPLEITADRFADFLAHAALAYLRAGNPARALELADRALAARSGNATARLLRARILFRLGRGKEAAAVLSSFPGDETYGPAAAALAAAMDLDAGDYCYGASFYKAGSKTKKLCDSGMEKLGAGDLAGAERLLRDALAEDKNNTEALITLCVVKKKQGDGRAAAGLCARAARSSLARCTDKRSRQLAADALRSATELKAENKIALH